MTMIRSILVLLLSTASFNEAITRSSAAAWTEVSSVTPYQENQKTMTTQGEFYCNIKALTPAERVRHTELTNKLLASRRKVVETEKGYELQFTPSDIALAELAEWTIAESKCCPFFDFHIDLENEGRLLCLRLTGADGVKAFIRSEFHLVSQ